MVGKEYYCIGCNKNYQIYHFKDHLRSATEGQKEFFKENIPPEKTDVYICTKRQIEVRRATEQVLFNDPM